MAIEIKNPARSAKVVAAFGGFDILSGMALVALALVGVFAGNQLAAVIGGLLLMVTGVGLIMWSRHIASQQPSSGGRN